MLANAGNSRRAAISNLNCPPIVALELCREHLVGPLKVMCALLILNVNILVAVDSILIFLVSSRVERNL